jgi:hypothetical protein
MHQRASSANRTSTKPGPQMVDEPKLGTSTPEESNSSHSFRPPTPQFYLYSQVEMYMDLGDQAGEDDCTEYDRSGRLVGFFEAAEVGLM